MIDAELGKKDKCLNPTTTIERVLEWNHSISELIPELD
jgi:hypothetical protein